MPHWRKEEWVLGFLCFWAGSCYSFFLACVTIRTNFLKCFAVRAVWNALQPQISVINVVSNLIWVRSWMRRLVLFRDSLLPHPENEPEPRREKRYFPPWVQAHSQGGVRGSPGTGLWGGKFGWQGNTVKEVYPSGISSHSNNSVHKWLR